MNTNINQGSTVGNDKETKQKLLDSAKKEFMEKGYMQASLRNICKNAGVTTGALYFFFKDKEDLFESLVHKPLELLNQIMKEHYLEEMERTQIEVTDWTDFSVDREAAKQVLHYLYQYYDEFHLILTKSQGSRFEYTVETIVAVSEAHYRRVTDQITERMQKPRIDDYMIHWFTHMHIDTFIHMLTHEESEAEALKHMDTIMDFLISGWLGMFR